MISNNTSLTQTFVINPTMDLCNDHSSFLSKELAARILVAFTSVFAAVDVCIHLAAGLLEGGGYLLQQALPMPAFSVSSQSAIQHLSSAWFFAKVAAGGSLAGLINPKSVRHFENTKTLIPAEPGVFYNPLIEKLIMDIANGEETAPFPNICHFLANASLEKKHELMEAINANFKTDAHLDLYECIKGSVHKSIAPEREFFLEPRALHSLFPWGSPDIENASLAESFYFHPTYKEELKAILKEGKVPIKHEKIYRGVPVLTTPEPALGGYLLGFNRSIEFLSTPNNSFFDGMSFWAIFSRAVPLEALECILVSANDREEVNALQNIFAHRNISVIQYDEAVPMLRQVRTKNLGIPKEWQDDGREVKERILMHLNRAPSVRRTSLYEDLQEPFLNIRSFFPVLKGIWKK
jgi:hypothetical protein